MSRPIHISRGLVDKHEYVRAHANNAACELHLYLGVLVPGYDTAHTESLLDAFDEARKRNDA